MGPAVTDWHVESVRGLFRAYVESLGIPLQAFHAEIDGLPGRYAMPAGTLLLARDGGGDPIGCAGVRPLDVPGGCELKRLYVRTGARGAGAGRALLAAALAFATSAGYAEMLLDTMPDMAAAQALYRAHGFVQADPYQDTLIPGLLFFRKALA